VFLLERVVVDILEKIMTYTSGRLQRQVGRERERRRGEEDDHNGA
jgi:hypothetical protein